MFIERWVRSSALLTFWSGGSLVLLPCPRVLSFPYRDRTRASTLCCFCLFFPSFECSKNLLIMIPNNTKTHQKVWFFHILLWIILSESCFKCKKTPNLTKRLFLCFVSKPRVGPINSKHNNFKWGNIFAGICTLVSSLIFMHFPPAILPFQWYHFCRRGEELTHLSKNLGITMEH